MANFQDDGYLSMEDQQRAIAMIGAQDIPDQADLGVASDLQQRERLVEQREQALNARLAQHDQEVNDRIAQRDQEYQQFHAQELRRIEQEAARWAEDQKMQLKTMANEFEHHTLEQAEAYIKERSRQVPTLNSPTPSTRPHERISVCPSLGHENKEEDKKVNAKDYLMWTKKVGIWDKLTTHQGHNVCTKNVAIVNAVKGKSSEILMLGLGDVDKAINRGDFPETVIFPVLHKYWIGDAVSFKDKSIAEYTTYRRGAQTFEDYITHTQTLHDVMVGLGCELSDEIRGSMLISGAGLTENQRNMLMATTRKSLLYNEVADAMRMLFGRTKIKSMDQNESSYHTRHSDYGQPQNRKGSGKGQGKGYGKGYAKGQGKGQQKGGRGKGQPGKDDGTGCWNCGKPGHFARECFSKPSGKGYWAWSNSDEETKDGAADEKVLAAMELAQAMPEELCQISNMYVYTIMDEGLHGDKWTPQTYLSTHDQLMNSLSMVAVIDPGATANVVGLKWLQQYLKRYPSKGDCKVLPSCAGHKKSFQMAGGQVKYESYTIRLNLPLNFVTEIVKDGHKERLVWTQMKFSVVDCDYLPLIVSKPQLKAWGANLCFWDDKLTADVPRMPLQADYRASAQYHEQYPNQPIGICHYWEALGRHQTGLITIALKPAYDYDMDENPYDIKAWGDGGAAIPNFRKAEQSWSGRGRFSRGARQPLEVAAAPEHDGGERVLDVDSDATSVASMMSHTDQSQDFSLLYSEHNVGSVKREKYTVAVDSGRTPLFKCTDKPPEATDYRVGGVTLDGGIVTKVQVKIDGTWYWLDAQDSMYFAEHMEMDAYGVEWPEALSYVMEDLWRWWTERQGLEGDMRWSGYPDHLYLKPVTSLVHDWICTKHGRGNGVQSCLRCSVELDKLRTDRAGPSSQASIDMAYLALAQKSKVVLGSHAVLDLGCTSNLCGEEWIKNWVRRGGLVRRLPKVGKMFEVAGGQVCKEVYQAELLFTVADCDGPLGVMNLVTSVIVGDTPLLVSKQQMKQWAMIIDVEAGTVLVKDKGVTITPRDTNSGLMMLGLVPAVERTFLATAALWTDEAKLEKTVKKLHVQFGHAHINRVRDTVKLAFPTVSHVLLENVCKDFVCKTCKDMERVRKNPVVAMPKALEFNHTLGMDVFFVETLPILHVVCLFSNYRLLRYLQEKTGRVVLDILWDRWISVFGVPCCLLIDLGPEFNNEDIFSLRDTCGVVIKAIPAGAHWSLGQVEQKHSQLRYMLVKLSKTMNKTIQQVIPNVNWAVNNLSDHRGFVPQQIVLGCLPRMQHIGKLDDVRPDLLMDRSSDRAIQKTCMMQFLELMGKARLAHAGAVSKNRFHTALRSQMRDALGVDYAMGQMVDYYSEVAKGKECWRGPVKVVGVDEQMIVMLSGGRLITRHRHHVRHHVADLGTDVPTGFELLENLAEEVDLQGQHVGEGSDLAPIPLLGGDDVDGEGVDSERVVEEVGDGEVDAGGLDDPSMSVVQDVELTGGERVPDDVQSGEASTPYQLKHLLAALESAKDNDGGVSGKHTEDEVPGQGDSGTDGKFVLADLLREVERVKADTGVGVEIRDDTEQANLARRKKGRNEVTGKRTRMQDFADAMQKELKDWKQYQVYQEVDDEGQHTISVRWVHTFKYNDQQEFVAKSRLVARGFQDPDVLDLDVMAPTAGKSTWRMLLTITAARGWTPKSIDITKAFLQGKKLQRNVYIRPPKQANVPFGKIWKLIKAVYGLSDAPKMWFDVVREFFIEIGASVDPMDEAVFWWFFDKELAGVISVHVDDFYWAGTVLFERTVICKIKVRFPVGSEQSGTFVYIGMQVGTDEEGVITVTQREYIEGIEEIPAEAASYVSGAEMTTAYRGLVGQLMWAVVQTCIPMSFETIQLSTKSNAPTLADVKQANKVCRKMKRRIVTLRFPKINLSTASIVGYCDAAWANLEGGATAGGYLVMLVGEGGECAFWSWRCRKLRRVVRSTTAAETFILADLVDELWLARRLWGAITGRTLPVLARTDSRNVHDHVHVGRQMSEKRLLVELATVKDAIRNGDLKGVEWVDTRMQLADCLTKAMVPTYLWQVLDAGQLS